jgi:hypothetical protein
MKKIIALSVIMTCNTLLSAEKNNISTQKYQFPDANALYHRLRIEGYPPINIHTKLGGKIVSYAVVTDEAEKYIVELNKFRSIKLGKDYKDNLIKSILDTATKL